MGTQPRARAPSKPGRALEPVYGGASRRFPEAAPPRPRGRKTCSLHFTPRRKSFKSRPFRRAGKSQGRKIRGRDTRGWFSGSLQPSNWNKASVDGWSRDILKSQKKGIFKTICKEGFVNSSLSSSISRQNQPFYLASPGSAPAGWGPTSTPPNPPPRTSLTFPEDLALPKWREGLRRVGPGIYPKKKKTAKKSVCLHRVKTRGMGQIQPTEWPSVGVQCNNR